MGCGGVALVQVQSIWDNPLFHVHVISRFWKEVRVIFLTLRNILPAFYSQKRSRTAPDRRPAPFSNRFLASPASQKVFAAAVL